MFNYILLILIETTGINSLVDNGPLLPNWLLWVLVFLIPIVLFILLYFKYKDKILDIKNKKLQKKKAKLEIKDLENTNRKEDN